MAPPSHEFYDSRSLEFHKLIALRLREDPLLLMIASATLERWKRVTPNESTDLEWTSLLSSGVTAVIAAVVDESHEGQRLRQSSPLLGVLSIEERRLCRSEASRAARGRRVRHDLRRCARSLRAGCGGRDLQQCDRGGDRCEIRGAEI